MLLTTRGTITFSTDDTEIMEYVHEYILPDNGQSAHSCVLWLFEDKQLQAIQKRGSAFKNNNLMYKMQHFATRLILVNSLIWFFAEKFVNIIQREVPTSRWDEDRWENLFQFVLVVTIILRTTCILHNILIFKSTNITRFWQFNDCG